MLNNLFTKSNSPDYSQETIDILRLIRSENVGPKTFRHLIKLFGNAKVALENIGEYSVRGGRKKPIITFSISQAEQEMEKLAKHNAKLLTYKCEAYPFLLNQIEDFPPILTYKGNIELLNTRKLIAIVEARNSSANGRIFASKISKELVAKDWITVSGLARGIDTAVHQASPGKTIAVLAGGIDYIYPPENAPLYKKLVQESLVLAELPVESKPLPQNFPQRNRIISGLSLASVVIEAGIKSGSLITANFAIEQNRDLFAVPGFPLDPRCMGGNRLIKQGAYLLETADDIIENCKSIDELENLLAENNDIMARFNLPVNDNFHDISISDREKVASLISSSSITYEQLALDSDLPLPIIYSICLELELAGKLTRHPGNRISLVF
jgi:DNA processing protein